MVSAKTFREMAMAFDHVSEQLHFEKTSFRIKKKIFATLDDKKATATLKLNAIDQSVFCAFDTAVFYPAGGAWGKQGWTLVSLAKAPKSMLADALNKSYLNVSNNK
jgi:predicted DNA-binding protein (MmcQ/YjbR family)